MTFHWARVVVKEYGTTFTWMTGYILVVMQNAWLCGDSVSSSPLAVTLWTALGLVVAAYLISRFLKKRQIIHG